MNGLIKKKNNTMLTWTEMHTMSSLSVQALIKISKYNKEEVLSKMKLSTYVTIRDSLGVDMLN